MSGRHKVLLFIAGAVVGLVTLVFVSAAVYNALVTDKISTIQDQNTAQADKRDEAIAKIDSLTRTIKSCTTPTGKCSKKNQKATAKAIADISRNNATSSAIATTAALTCQAQLQTTDFKRLYACTKRIVDQASRAEQRQQPSPGH